jgi:uncharacterized Zn-finger protein
MTLDDRGQRPPVTDEIEVFYVDSRTAVCDGGGGALGHPRVFLAIDRSDEVECPYCSRRFIYAPEADASTPGEMPGRKPGPKPR